MADKISPISRAVSDVLTGAYARKRLTQEQIARETDMPVVTLQKKLRGRAPVSATDLVLISKAIGVDPAKVLTEALEEVELSASAESPVSDQPVSLEAHREKKSIADMSVEEIESMELKAATHDEELEQDEPEAP